MSISTKQNYANLHFIAELAAVLVAAPFTLYLTTQVRSKRDRILVFIIAMLTIAVDGFLLHKWIDKKSLVMVAITFVIIIVAMFFRDPDIKVLPTNGMQILSPADGVVKSIRYNPCDNMTVISIFLSFFDVHVQRSPIDGVVRDVQQICDNKVMTTIQHDGSDNYVEVIQEGGMVTGEIINFLSVGQHVNVGDKIGKIKMGSHVHLKVPNGTLIQVNVGEQVHAGQRIIGEF